jgi:hypothetical protein
MPVKTMVTAFVVLVIFLATAVTLLTAVVVADDTGYLQYGNLNGYFYVFSDTSGLSIYDPVAQTVVKNIPDTAQQWGDAVFIRDQAQIKHYAFIADTGDPAAAPGNAYGKMYVYDTELQKLVSRVDIGLRPVRVYAVPQRDEVHLFFDGVCCVATTTVNPCFSLPRALPRALLLLPVRCCLVGVGASGRPRGLRRVPHVVGAVPQLHGRRP